MTRRIGALNPARDQPNTLIEAINLYRSAGYTEVDAFNDEPYAHHRLEKRIAT